MEALCSSETSVLETGTRRNIPEGDILRMQLYYHNHCQDPGKSASRQSSNCQHISVGRSVASQQCLPDVNTNTGSQRRLFAVQLLCCDP
jgi:hypothetical protein